MPAKNALKTYAANNFYHIYNRGVDKREIFSDDQDYSVFLSYLKTYLLPKETINLEKTIASHQSSIFEKSKAIKSLALNNFADEVELLAYSLLPNHFHLLIKQSNSETINYFARSLGTRYVGYFNRKYKRVGPLFQGVYKAVLVESEEHLLHLSRYIHLNPSIWENIPIQHWRTIKLPSSLPEYLGDRNTSWVKTETISHYFSKTNPNFTYFDFLCSNSDIEPIAELTIDLNDR